MSQKLAIFGSTGSIGKNAFKIALQNRDAFDLVLLTCKTNINLLYDQCVQLTPKFVLICNKDIECNEYHWLKKFADIGVKALFTKNDLAEIANLDFAICVVAISGFICLEYLQSILNNGYVKQVCLANKESIVCLGNALLKEFKQKQITLIPVDSEHNSIFQILQGTKKPVDSILITASGGTVFNKTYEELKFIKPKDVMIHPNWSMGAKITIDSSTMANKGLELIEACRLFELNENKVDVAINTKSIVHGLVKFCDYSALSFASNPDMLLHISHAMFYPKEIPQNFLQQNLRGFDIYDQQSFLLHKIDYKKYSMLAIARQVCKSNFLSLAYNCINEYLVQEFIDEKISFLQIANFTDEILFKVSKHDVSINNFDDAFAAKNLIDRAIISFVAS